MTAITSIVVSVVVSVTTNFYQPTQYSHPHVGCLVYGCTEVEEWKDVPYPDLVGNTTWQIGFQSRSRLNPDLKIREVVRTETFEWEWRGEKRTTPVFQEVLSKEEFRRKVQEEWDKIQ